MRKILIPIILAALLMASACQQIELTEPELGSGYGMTTRSGMIIDSLEITGLRLYIEIDPALVIIKARIIGIAGWMSGNRLGRRVLESLIMNGQNRLVFAYNPSMPIGEMRVDQSNTIYLRDILGDRDGEDTNRMLNEGLLFHECIHIWQNLENNFQEEPAANYEIEAYLGQSIYLDTNYNKKLTGRDTAEIDFFVILNNLRDVTVMLRNYDNPNSNLYKLTVDKLLLLENYQHMTYDSTLLSFPILKQLMR